MLLLLQGGERKASVKRNRCDDLERRQRTAPQELRYTSQPSCCTRAETWWFLGQFNTRVRAADGGDACARTTSGHVRTTALQLQLQLFAVQTARQYSEQMPSELSAARKRAT